MSLVWVSPSTGFSEEHFSFMGKRSRKGLFLSRERGRAGWWPVWAAQQRPGWISASLSLPGQTGQEVEDPSCCGHCLLGGTATWLWCSMEDGGDGSFQKGGHPPQARSINSSLKDSRERTQRWTEFSGNPCEFRAGELLEAPLLL